MIDFLAHIAICSLFCVGFHATTSEGMLLEFIVKPLEKAPFWIKKPFYTCPPCMSSWWGTLYFVGYSLTVSEFHIGLISMWVLFIFCVAGLNAILVKFFG